MESWTEGITGGQTEPTKTIYPFGILHMPGVQLLFMSRLSEPNLLFSNI